MSKLSKNNDPTSWWFYFEKTGNNAKCNHCPWENDRDKNFSTNKLKYHLSTQHHKLFQKNCWLKKSKLSNAKKKKQKQNRYSKNNFQQHQTSGKNLRAVNAVKSKVFQFSVLFSPLLNHQK